jgi:DNA ligase-1
MKTITEKDMQHGEDYQGQDVTGWMISEKHDGCRAYWDGYQMWTRGGKIVQIPAAMKAALPSGIAIDGEIHAGRGGFEIARQAVQYNKWVFGVVFSGFDLPGQPDTFERRYKILSYLIPSNGIVNYIEHTPCTGIASALETIQTIQAGAGEGAVVRNPVSLYRKGRTEDILKLVKKSFTP